MTFVAIGLITVGIVFAFNRVVFAPLTDRKIVFLIPLIEELSKTILPFFLSSSVLINHAFFGAFEAMYDLWLTGKRSSIIAVAGFLGHLFFGYMALVGINTFGHPAGGILLGYLPHLTWNFLTIKLENIDSK